MSSRLASLPAHYAFYVLRHSQSLPKLAYTVTFTPSWKFLENLQAFDDVLRSSLANIPNVNLSAWTQVTWPVARGGLGLRRASDVSLPAFLSSAHGTQGSVELLLPAPIASTPDYLISEGLTLWQARTQARPPAQDKLHVQKEWDSPSLEKSIGDTINAATSSLSKARFLGASAPESGAFLNALPSPSLGTLMDCEAFRIAVAIRLGADVCTPHSCQCGSQVLSDGLHGLHCRHSTGRRARHSAANSLIQRALASAGVPSSLEPNHLLLHSNVRPDGASNIPWSQGKSVTWDFTCTSSLAPSYLEYSSGERLYAASLAESNKRAKYAAFSDSHIFVPIAIECLGAMGKEGKTFLQEVGRRITANTGEPRAAEFLLQRVSVAVQRGNALSIRGTLPTSDSLNDCLGNL